MHCAVGRSDLWSVHVMTMCFVQDQFFAAVTGLAKLANLSHYQKILRFSTNLCEFDSFYLLMSQKRALITLCSFNNEIKDKSIA